MVALDKVPERWEVSVGSRVFFPQGELFILIHIVLGNTFS